jgi:AcrR family transcriptional regulator
MEKGEKRCAVIQAAMELVAENGFHGAPMALVAERAGVAAGTIYRYFESKDILILATYQDLEERLRLAILDGYPEGRPVRERFLHVGQVMLRYMLASPLEFRFLEQFHNSPYGADHRREKIFGKGDFNLIPDLFEEGRREQIVKDLPLPVLLSLVFGPLVHICRDAILGFVTLDDRLITETVEACWDALKR